MPGMLPRKRRCRVVSFCSDRFDQFGDRFFPERSSLLPSRELSII